jgi:hypothetical protein
MPHHEAVFVAIVLLASRIPPWSLNGIAAIVGVALVAGVGMWWLVARARRKPPTHHWVVTYSAPRWDSPLGAPSVLTRDRSRQYFLDNEAVARTDLEDEWTAFVLPSGIVTYVRTDVVQQALPE